MTYVESNAKFYLTSRNGNETIVRRSARCSARLIPAPGLRVPCLYGSPEPIGVSGCEAAPIDVDLVVDEPEVLPDPLKTSGDLGSVPLQKLKSLPLVARPDGDKLGVAADHPDRHPGRPQPGAHADPFQVELAVPSAPSAAAVHGGDNQPGPLVVAQRVDADPGSAGCLGDRHPLRGNLPAWLLRGVSLYFEHTLNCSVALMTASGSHLTAQDKRSRRLVPRSLRHRNYTLLWSGQTVSVLGDGIYTIAIAVEALHISDHPTTLAYAEAARVAPNAILLLLAGALVDRLPRRLVILVADLLRGVAVAAIAVLAAENALNVTELVLLSAAVGVGDAFFYPAYRAVMPELLPAGLLVQGNAFNSASQTVGLSFVGPAVGGVLVALGGTPIALTVDAATFAVSTLCLLLMTHIPAPAPSGRSVAADVGEGLRWTIRQRWLWFGILAVGVSNFAGFSPTAVTFPLLIRNVLHQGPAAYGVTFAAAGAGGLVAAIVAARLGSPRRRMSMIWAAWAVASFALAGVGAAPDVFVAAACAAVTYYGIVYGNLLWGALMQAEVPAAMLGRASSVDWLFSTCLSPLGVLFAGVLAAPLGTRKTILFGAALSAASCLVVFVPGVRDPDGHGGQPPTALRRKGHPR